MIWHIGVRWYPFRKYLFLNLLHRQMKKEKSELELLKKENEELRKELEIAELRAENERLKRRLFETKYPYIPYGITTLSSEAKEW